MMMQAKPRDGRGIWHGSSLARLGGRTLAAGAAWAALVSAAISQTPGQTAPQAEPGLSVVLEERVASAPVTGRLLVFLLREGASVGRGAEPADAPFYDDPQPIFGTNVSNWSPGAVQRLPDTADAFPSSLRDLPPGVYTAQAVLDVADQNSDWRREPGNLFSKPVRIEVAKGGLPPSGVLTLSERVSDEKPEWFAKVKVVEVPSPLLSAARGKPVTLRAGVVPPRDFDGAKSYAAVYVVPGFGGDHQMALGLAARRAALTPGTPDYELARSTYLIVLDPEGPNGHHLFADSANNGPVGTALTKELIPALERELPLRTEPAARIITGHSSGGWSSLWLALTYPQTFGACWSGAPDPVDFHAMQKINLYEAANFYTDAAGNELPSNEQGGKVLMTIRQENQWEQVRGPGNTSGQQWDSWFAVFGPRDETGHPAALFDPATGVIDRAVAKQYKEFDIVARLKADSARYVPLFRERIRITVGGEDEWELDAAVALLDQALKELGVPMDGTETPGRITIVPGTNHGTVLRSPAYRAIPAEMVAHLEKHGLLVKPVAAR